MAKAVRHALIGLSVWWWILKETFSSQTTATTRFGKSHRLAWLLRWRASREVLAALMARVARFGSIVRPELQLMAREMSSSPTHQTTRYAPHALRLRNFL